METLTIAIKKDYAREVINDLQAMNAIDIVESKEERKQKMLDWIKSNKEKKIKIDPSVDIRALIDETHDRGL